MWQMHNQNIVTRSFVDFLNAGLQSPKMDFIKKSLLGML